MKKEDLKQIIKPLIKECLREVLIEEGFTKMLSEVKQPQPTMRLTQQIKQENAKEQKINLQETKKKMLDAIGQSGFDPFAGSEPLKEDKELITGDPGIDISKLVGENKQVWKQTLNALNGKKVKE